MPDGADGAALGVEPALNAALASVAAIHAIEHVNGHNADVASPVAVQQLWEEHSALPGSPPAADLAATSSYDGLAVDVSG